MPSAAANKKFARTPLSRVFLTKNGSGPANPPVYQTLGRAGAVDWPQGDVTPVYVPSASSYDEFEVAEIIRGQTELPTLDLEFRKEGGVRSEILKIVSDRCALDIGVHTGTCQNPSDPDAGWETILVMESAYPDSYGTGEQGAFEGDQNEAVTETMPVTALRLYEIGRVGGAAQATDEVTDNVVGIAICDRKQCGACGIESDGCQVAFAVQGATTGSPGLPVEALYTSDGGGTWNESVVTSAALTEAPTGLACVGVYVVIITGGSNDRLHYALAADLVEGVGTWTAVATGFVGAGSPAAIFSADPLHTWIVGAGGYIYFVSDPTAGVDAVQSTGDATPENLTSVHALNSEIVVAVGANNAVVYTENGGASWNSVTGPAVGVALNCVWVHSQNTWFVGSAGGRLYYTRNKGLTWAEKGFPGSGAGQVRAINFASQKVGYMAHDTAASVGRILRTVHGGYSWYVLPEGTGTLPSHERLNSLSSCADDPNIVFGAGLRTGNDGIIVKVA